MPEPPNPYASEQTTLRLFQMKSEVVNSWEKGDMVKAFKITIQSIKLLTNIASTTDTATLPQLFLLVTEVLETFGNLVYSRIKTKAQNSAKALGSRFPDVFSHMDVPEEARLIASNWVSKISSVRELLPRLLIEVATIRIYLFLAPSHLFSHYLDRMLRQCRGMGDSMVALFCRSFICYMGQELCPERVVPLTKLAISDFLMTFPEHDSQSRLILTHEVLSVVEPLIKCMAFGLSFFDYQSNQKTDVVKSQIHDYLISTFELYNSKRIVSLPVICGLVGSFPPETVNDFLLTFLDYLESNVSIFPKAFYTPLSATVELSRLLSNFTIFELESGSKRTSLIGKLINRIWNIAFQDYDTEDPELLSVDKLLVAGNLSKFICKFLLNGHPSKAEKFLNILLF
ncbi:hypothetical protein GEMRC1_014152 [Eukaryota sp. GEM-RC1]